jgi:predicted TIM-barrel fold metal-dependent hydrolase
MRIDIHQHVWTPPPIEPRDPAVFYDTSSYGPVAIELLTRYVGERQLLFGSDLPVVEPVHSGYEAVLASNAGGLVGGSIAMRVAA